MSDLETVSFPNQTDFLAESPKRQIELIPQLIKSGSDGLAILTGFLDANRSSITANLVTAKAYQVLYQANTWETKEILAKYFPQGMIPLASERNIDYEPLQQLLLKQDFQAADSLTRVKMCELAGVAAIKRKWIYFTEIEQFPTTDLHTMNQIWWLFSEGKFGFAVQRKIWLSLGQDFVQLWPKIGWKNGNEWTRYPGEFTWDLTAPAGHLPLFNQIRGVRVIASVFAHPAWAEKS
ncbi:GUN4 domain-containing protein [Gloeocapsa sp. PCC 73106]|uniref:GUN4 domain-containing protein n=1 Tax=Gloeocapsa sp. PCC 73106 TaxID=102232 RepID=UPI0002ACFB62|nr:GUN4 domain-containing protein [Gloeocapsa sp. PCC 73106]ELR98790.1 GUN4 [Gloeocapsa sp. PCC 73106]